MDSWQRLFTRRNRVAWVVLLVCFSLTLIAWYGLSTQAIKNAGQQFELHVNDVIDSIEERLRQHEQILLGGAGLLDASNSVTRAEWRAYIERLNLKNNYPGIQGVGFSRVIKPAELQAHIATIRAEGFSDYTVRPPGKRPLYTSIIYLEPFLGRNLAAFGYDMMSEATRASAMRMAAESGRTSISGKVKLVQETHGKEQAGFLMYVPVFRRHLSQATLEERWNALKGFVYSPYRVDDLMAGILGSRALKLDFAIFDGEEETDGSRIFTSAHEQVDGKRATPPEMTTLRTIHAYGHTWTVRLHSRPEFDAGFHSPLNAVILALGAGISILLFVIVSFLASRRERAEEMAIGMTQRIRKNEKHLTEINSRFELATDSAGIGVWDFDIITGNLVWDSWMYRLYQVEKDEFEGAYSAWKSRLHPEDIERSEAELWAAIESDKNFDTTFRIVWKNGEVRHIKAHACVERDQENRLVHMIGINYDITARKQVDDALKEAAQYTKTILDNVLDGIITIDELGSVSSFNHGAEIIFGFFAEEVIGRNIKMLMPEPYHSQHDGYLHNYVTTGLKKIIGIGREVVGQRKNGETFPMDLAVSEITHAEKRMFIGLIRDITERKLAEDELRKLSRAIEQSPVSVLITDAVGNIEYVNAKFSEVTGYSAQEVMGRNPRIVQSGLTPIDVYRSMWETILGGKYWRGKLQNRKKSGELFWEEIHISAIRDSESKATNFVAVTEDITERIKVERMKSEFVSIVSHELRTPLTSIRGSLGLLAGGVGGELPAQAQALVEIAHKNSERLILLVNDILDMEKIESGKMDFQLSPIKLMPLLKQAVDGNRAYAEQYRVSYELESEVPEAMVNVDANRLIQVLANLLSNAAKFSHVGGKVTVAATSDGERIRVAVNDHGSGISDEFRDRIFQKFAQADSSDTRKKGGTGLGLSITKAMVEQMGGSIGFYSNPNVLTTFFFEFPIWQA